MIDVYHEDSYDHHGKLSGPGHQFAADCVKSLREVRESCNHLLGQSRIKLNGDTADAEARLGEAIRYALTRWDGLSRFLEDGRVDLDSNTVERSIRPLALNRKNALFDGSDEGGDDWAVIATLIKNCKISGINPHDWLSKTPIKLANGHKTNSVGELMPWSAVA